MLPPDNPWPVVLVLLCVAIGFGLSWTRSKKRSSLAVALISLGLGTGCYAWSQTVETPSKIIVRNLHEITAALEERNGKKVQSFFSKQGKVPVALLGMISEMKVTMNVHLTDISVRFKEQNSLATSHFRANGTFKLSNSGDGEYIATRWELDWQKEANEWKIVDVRRLHLMNGSEVNLLTGL